MLNTKELRRCLREPIAEIFRCAELLQEATTAHLSRDVVTAERLLRQADDPQVRQWTNSLWGAKSPYAPSRRTVRLREILAKDARVVKRMPTKEEKQQLIARDGRHCRFCQIPLIRAEVRERFRKLYPLVQIWGNRTSLQHAAFQAMWLQYDHVVPHAYGGNNGLENIVLTCAPCNYSRMEYSVEEAGLEDPRLRPPVKSDWDGLERILAG